MNAHDDPADELLIERLRGLAARVDPPPPAVDEAARHALLSLRVLDEELAALVMDSAAGAGALLRDNGDQVRLLSFETDTVSIELQIREDADHSWLRGLVAGVTGQVEVETADTRRSVDISADGWFTVDELPAGMVRLRMTTPDGTTVVTGWWST